MVRGVLDIDNISYDNLTIIYAEPGSSNCPGGAQGIGEAFGIQVLRPRKSDWCGYQIVANYTGLYIRYVWSENREWSNWNKLM